MSRRKTYSISFKLKVIKHAKATSLHKTSKDFGIARKRIREWKQSEKTLREALELGKRKNRLGAGRPCEYPDIDAQLHVWVCERREAGCRVTGTQIQKEARRLHLLKGNQSFKAGSQWLDRFMLRYNLTHRR